MYSSADTDLFILMALINDQLPEDVHLRYNLELAYLSSVMCPIKFCDGGQDCLCTCKKLWWDSTCDICFEFTPADCSNRYRALAVLGKNAKYNGRAIKHCCSACWVYWVRSWGSIHKPCGSLKCNVWMRMSMGDVLEEIPISPLDAGAASGAVVTTTLSVTTPASSYSRPSKSPPPPPPLRVAPPPDGATFLSLVKALEQQVLDQKEELATLRRDLAALKERVEVASKFWQ